jgi:Ca2+-transporting ATPase
MTVRVVFCGGEGFAVSVVGYAPEGAISRTGETVDVRQHPALMECLKSGLLCNDSALAKTEAGWKAEGDPTEAALIVSARKAGLFSGPLTGEHPRLDAIPFESQHQYMATLHQSGPDSAPDSAPVVFLKGAVESILQRCDSALGENGERVALDAPAVLQCVAEMAADGLRVLAFACVELPRATTAIQHQDLTSGLTFLGLQGMIDPPRPEAVQAVRVCQKAGIRVKMITGDHAGTAAAIAAQIGLEGADRNAGIDNVITGRMLT